MGRRKQQLRVAIAGAGPRAVGFGSGSCTDRIVETAPAGEHGRRSFAQEAPWVFDFGLVLRVLFS